MFDEAAADWGHGMLSGKSAIATVAVKDLEVASRFYEGVLGLRRSGGEEGAIAYESGATRLFVYASQYAGTNKATSVTWIVGDKIDEMVRSLAAKGLAFEHYELPAMTREGDVHVAGALRVAWFKDPDGNIHGLINR